MAQDLKHLKTFEIHYSIMCPLFFINRGSYMSAHDLLNLLNELGKRD